MPQIETLAYSPTTNMETFVDFVVNGSRDANGNFLKDDQDRLITGVLAWLHGREIPEARFFSSASDDPVQLFVSVIQPTEPEAVPWMSRIPGFEAMVRKDGQIGLVPDSTVAAIADMSLNSVKPRPDLDALFVAGKKKIEDIDFEKLSFDKPEFLDALKGVPGADVQPMAAEVEKELNLVVAEEHLEFRPATAKTAAPTM